MLENVNIIYQDENILCVDKPSGLVVHTDERTVEPSLCDFLEINFPDLKDIGRPHTLDNERYVPRYGMLTRLDRATSGLILIAKNEKAFDFLESQYKHQTIKKEYTATLEGDLSFDLDKLITENKIQKLENYSYVINKDIGRSKIDPRKWTSGDDIRNTKRQAITHFKILEVTSIDNKYQTKVQVYPQTGRTHQIRVHFYFLGFPIMGDQRYFVNQPDVNDEMMLHAQSIEFININGEKLKLETIS